MSDPEQINSNITSTNGSRYILTASIQIAFLCVVCFISLVENAFLFCVSHTFIHQWLSRRSKQQYLDTFRSTASSTNVPLRQPQKNERPKSESHTSHRCTRLLTCFGIADERELHNSVTTDDPCSGYSSKSVGTVTRYYFGNMCIANLLLMLLAVPFNLVASVGTNQDVLRWDGAAVSESTVQHKDNILLRYPMVISELTCTFVECVVSSLLMVSILSLVLLTADRLVAICTPLHYSQWMTRRRTVYCIVFTWMLTLSTFIIPHMCSLFQHLRNEESIIAPKTDIYRCFVLGQHDTEHDWKLAVVYFTFIFVLPLLFITVAYIKIYITVRNCLKQVSGCEVSLHSVPSGKSYSSLPNVNAENDVDSACPVTNSQSRDVEKIEHSRLARRRNVLQSRVAKSACIFVSSFFCLTAPFFTLILVGATVDDTINPTINSISDAVISDEHEIRTTWETTEIFSFISVWFLYINSFTTPALYSCYDGVLRRRIVTILSGLYRKRSMVM
ncbi:hypothetical protein CLF_107021 [Clonorchis sinensis]|uniref:G-protein coupled receptors family 1 profile domain-containing protein n=1 Tax=Clonorchis sinensis TaxID=79923 RepID=H2KTZ4_CLOSI|nr:hypothetical protein CLF_107021 [Clonorchis sinensis]